MDTRTFKKICSIVYDRAGIALKDNKQALVSARIGKRVTALNLPDSRAYLEFLENDRTENELIQLLDVISTNVTSFFRESDHYVLLENAVSDWVSLGQRRFRLWSAACSTGEEPYSMAMTLLKNNDMSAADLKILATDISTRVLAHSRSGVYSEKSLKTVPADLRNKYFYKYHQNGSVSYEVKSTLKKLVTFRRLNLSAPPFPMRGPLDIIFCCNVMIYFDNPGRKKVIDEIYRLLRPGGYLVVGHAESLSGIETDLKMIQPSVYQKQE